MSRFNHSFRNRCEAVLPLVLQQCLLMRYLGSNMFPNMVRRALLCPIESFLRECAYLMLLCSFQLYFPICDLAIRMSCATICSVFAVTCFAVVIVI